MKGPCIVCNGSPRYRCPSCGHLYCSLPCYKTHKETLCFAASSIAQGESKEEQQVNDIKKEEDHWNENGNDVTKELISDEEKEEGELSESEGMDESDEEEDFDCEDLVPQERLAELEKSLHLRNLLCNKHLKEMLLHINESQSPATLIQEFMQIPIFVEFADECLNLVSTVNGATEA